MTEYGTKSALLKVAAWFGGRGQAERYAAMVPSEGTLGSNIDVCLPTRVAGWALDLEDVARPVELDVLVDGAFYQRIRADGERDDLRAIIGQIVGGGFAFAPPAGEGKATIAIRCKGRDLRASPFEIELQPARTLPAREVPAVALPEAVRRLAEKLPSEGALASNIDERLPTHVSGWAIDLARPGRPAQLDVLIDGMHFATVRAEGTRGDLRRIIPEIVGGGFEFVLPPGSGPARVAVRHDGQDLRGSPFEIELQPQPALPSLARRAKAPGVAAAHPPVAIVVPVYNAPGEVGACLDAIIRHTTREARLIVIDDASPDPAVEGLLARYRGRANVEILRNAENLGYTRTINRGIAAAGGADVVLLNSDTAVGPRWLEHLAIAAHSATEIASVTAVSDNAGAFTVPDMNAPRPLPAGLSMEDYQRRIAQTAGCYWPQVPTGNGFCTYLRRDALDAVGLFDADGFPRGYGEENDWAMRALRAGWRHIVDDCTLVHHERSASFGAEKTALLKASRAVIDARYPEYGALIDVFRTGRAINGVRQNVRRLHGEEMQGGAVRPRLLFVIATESGGTPLTNRDLMTALADRYEPFLLVCDGRSMKLVRIGTDGVTPDETVERHVLAEPMRLADHVSSDYDETLAHWLVRHAIELMHVRHVAWHSLDLAAVAQGLGIPVVFSFHDFYTVCPTVKLLDENAVFCGGRCTATPGPCLPELWPARTSPPLKGRWVGEWRRKLAGVFEACDAFVTTSRSARSTIAEAFPVLDARRFEVIAHGRDFAELAAPRLRERDGRPLDILVPGHISPAKGRDIIEALAARDRGQNLRFHILGSVYPPLEGEGIVDHGRYEREEFAARVRAIGPDIGAVLSIWSETYCHTLTELWAAGLPVIGFDFGAVAERIRATGAGWILPHEDISRLYEELLALANAPERVAEKNSAVARWQESESRTGTCGAMAERYAALYEKVVEARRPFRLKA